MALKANKTRKERNLVYTKIGVHILLLTYVSRLQIDSQKNNQNMNSSHLKHAYVGILVCMHLIPYVCILRQIRVSIDSQQKQRRLIKQLTHNMLFYIKEHIKGLKTTKKHKKQESRRRVWIMENIHISSQWYLQ